MRECHDQRYAPARAKPKRSLVGAASIGGRAYPLACSSILRSIGAITASVTVSVTVGVTVPAAQSCALRWT